MDDEQSSTGGTTVGDADVTVRLPFAFEERVRRVAALFGVRPSNARVEVSADELLVHFGLWRLRTSLANVAGTTLTGPYQWWKVAGPPRLSLADHGITFGTNTQRGLCVTFRRPVSAIAPGPWIRHPGATVTVAEPERLQAILAERSGTPAA